MRTARQTASSNIYHVMFRGVGKQIIFEDDVDRQKMASLFEHGLAADGEIFAWCLMDNHAHVLVRMELEELARAMRRLLSGYALFFNARHGRSGHLFQDRYKSEPVENDAYLLTVVRYIHQNPENAGLARTDDYPWSSYSSYLSGSGFCSTDMVLDMLGGADGFRRFHADLAKDGCLDVGLRRRRVSDAKALDIARELLGDSPVEGINALSRPERNDAICKLRAAGLSIRQTQRATGLGVGVIAHARPSQQDDGRVKNLRPS